MKKSINRVLMIMGLFCTIQMTASGAGGSGAFGEGLVCFFSAVEDAAGTGGGTGWEPIPQFVRTFFDLGRPAIQQALQVLPGNEAKSQALRGALRVCLQQGEAFGALLKVQYATSQDLKTAVQVYTEGRREAIEERGDFDFIESLRAELDAEIDCFYSSSASSSEPDHAVLEDEVNRLYEACWRDFFS